MFNLWQFMAKITHLNAAARHDHCPQFPFCNLADLKSTFTEKYCCIDLLE